LRGLYLQLSASEEQKADVDWEPAVRVDEGGEVKAGREVGE
jgi:hypothetical protein